MLCSRCGKSEAAVYFKQILNNKVSEFHFCADCAKSSALGPVGASSPIFELLGGLSAPQESPQRRLQRLQCASCGLKYSEFRDSGQLGCLGCYESFAEPLQDILKYIHGTLRHRGKSPPPSPSQVERKRRVEEIVALRRQLEAAIRGEKFEDAARLRDRLRQMEA